MAECDLRLYVLNETRELRPVRDSLNWLEWMGEHRALTLVAQEWRGAYFVVTMFLGFDHAQPKGYAEIADGEGPLVFETMGFEHYKPNENRLVMQAWCATYDAALQQHARIAAALTVN